MTSPDARAALLARIVDTAIVHGEVTLSSGATASYYVDLRRITLDGQAAPLVGEVMLDLAAGLDFDAVGGLTLGAEATAVEDTSTTGGSVLTAGQALREAGAEVVGVAVIVDRDTGSAEAIGAQGLEYRYAFGKAELGL